MPNQPVRRLGRGLSSLISVPEEVISGTPAVASPHAQAVSGPPARLRVDQLRPNAFQPRKEIDPADLKSLADSITQSGLIQPIVVRPVAKGVYEIIAGERRWRAAPMAGLSEIPVVIREATDEQMLELALVENIFRSDLNPIDRAFAYRRYCNEFNLSAEEVAEKLGEDRSTVSNYLRLLELPQEVKDWVIAGKLSMGHARCLLGIRSASDLVGAARHAIERDLSVRAIEKLVRERAAARESAGKAGRGGKEVKRPQIRALEEAFIQALGTKVEIAESRRKGSGKLTIHYYSLDDFDRVAERLGVKTN